MSTVDEVSVPSPIASLSHAAMYAILSMCFAPPTAELLGEAQSGALTDALAEALANLPAEQGVDERALQAFKALPPKMAPDGPHGTLEALEVEYTRLFVGPGAPLVSPYESVHVDREQADIPGLIWGKTTLAVRDAYREAGLTLRPGPEPPDHLAAELEFLAFLSQAESASLARGDRRQAESARQRRTAFLADHLHRWAPTIAERVAAEARHPLYEAAGRLLKAALTAEL